MPNSTVEVPTPDGSADAYVSRPDGGEVKGGVLFLIDAFGLRPRIEEMCDRIAERGYEVLAPNLFYRAGRAPLFEMPDLSDPDTRASFFGKVRPLMEELTPERIAADGQAYLDYLGEHVSGPVVLTGYCMGARMAWRIAAADPDRVAALAGFHAGGLVTDADDSPHLSAEGLRGIEVLFGHADNDPSNSAEQIQALDEALEAAGVRHHAEVYAGAAHGYTMSDTAAYNEEAAERHFTELFSLLDRVA